MYTSNLSPAGELSTLTCTNDRGARASADHGGLHGDVALPLSWWQLHGWEEGDGWDKGFAPVPEVGPWEQGHTDVLSLVSGAKHKPATRSPWGTRGAEQQREINMLPEGLGHLVLQRCQHHP